MLKYVWMIILVLGHIAAIAYVGYDAKASYDHIKGKNKKFDIEEFLSALDENTYVIVIVLTLGWFVVSMIYWAIQMAKLG